MGQQTGLARILDILAVDVSYPRDSIDTYLQFTREVSCVLLEALIEGLRLQRLAGSTARYEQLNLEVRANSRSDRRNLFIVSAYAPTDCSAEAINNTYQKLHCLLSIAKRNDIVMSARHEYTSRSAILEQDTFKRVI